MMTKRTQTELRRLRLRDRILSDTVEEIDKIDKGKSDHSIRSMLDRCQRELDHVDEKESFLRTLELPNYPEDSADVIRRVKEQRKNDK